MTAAKALLPLNNQNIFIDALYEVKQYFGILSLIVVYIVPINPEKQKLIIIHC